MENNKQWRRRQRGRVQFKRSFLFGCLFRIGKSLSTRCSQHPPPPPTLLFVESLCLYSNKPTDVSQCTNPRFPLNGIKKNLPDLTLADLNTDSVYGPWIPCYSVTHMYVLTTGSIDQRPRAWLKRKKKRSAWSTKAPLHHSEHRMHLPATGVLL